MIRRMLAFLLSAATIGCAVPTRTSPTTTRPTLATQPAFSDARPGEVVRVPIATLDSIPTLAVIVTRVPGPPLVFSDGPEYFPGDGIALREDVPRGLVRLMLYHCPEAAGVPKTITAVIENRGTRPMTLRFARHSAPKPDGNYPRIGREGIVDFLSRRPGPPDRVVAPGERVVLDPALDRATVTKDELVHAFDELDLSEPARITVFQRDPAADSLKVVDALPTLPPNRHGAGRGQFPLADYEVTMPDDAAIETRDGPRQIVVADGKRDPWVVGHDAIDDAPSEDVGNYGVMYRVRLNVRSGDGRRMALLLAKPQDDKGYCPATTAAVAMRVGEDAWSLSDSRVVALPTSGTLKQFPQAALIGIVAPARDRQQTIELTYTPPAASCLPTPIILMPID